jgi:hypothetical protein
VGLIFAIICAYPIQQLLPEQGWNRLRGPVEEDASWLALAIGLVVAGMIAIWLAKGAKGELNSPSGTPEADDVDAPQRSVR